MSEELEMSEVIDRFCCVELGWGGGGGFCMGFGGRWLFQDLGGLAFGFG